MLEKTRILAGGFSSLSVGSFLGIWLIFETKNHTLYLAA
jgi:hypothetical protein